MVELVLRWAKLGAGFIGFTLLLLLAAWATRTEPVMEFLGVIWLVGTFLIRNFYFMAFELRPGAAKWAHRDDRVEPVASDRDSIAPISSASHAISPPRRAAPTAVA